MTSRHYNQRLRYPRLACYHLISRVVQRRMLLDTEAMEALRHIMRSQAVFCGMEVLTYCFLSNHFHIFVRLDPKESEAMDDGELLRRFRALYGSRRCASLGIDAERLAAVLEMKGAAAAELRRRLAARMGDVSVYMREVKTRFTLWYNARHQTVGTFWAERFRSVLVEAGSRAERLVAAYIDLNPVRAGMASEAAAYAYCGYGEAFAGGTAARRGIARIEGASEWTAGVRQRYAARLHGRAGSAKGEPGSNAEEDRAREGVAGDRLLSRIGAFSNGLAVGSVEWVRGFCGAGGQPGYRRKREPRIVPVAADHRASSSGDEVAAVRMGR